MKIFKNLFGNGSKIDADEIAISKDRLLGQSVIIDEGSNSNGSWIKFSNGIMICYSSTYVSGVSVSASGSLFVSPILTSKNYPVPFVEPPTVTSTTDSGFYHGWYTPSDGANTKGTEVRPPRFTITRTSAGTGLSFSVHHIAIGKWK